MMKTKKRVVLAVIAVMLMLSSSMAVYAGSVYIDDVSYASPYAGDIVWERDVTLKVNTGSARMYSASANSGSASAYYVYLGTYAQCTNAFTNLPGMEGTNTSVSYINNSMLNHYYRLAVKINYNTYTQGSVEGRP